jgi:signal transduction histidine kinase
MYWVPQTGPEWAGHFGNCPIQRLITITGRNEPPALHIDVADTGSGIPAAHLPHVFDRFYRADPARANSSARVGLGLAIVKSIATLHGGTVTIASEVGKGTCVTVTLPGRHFPKNA